MDIECPCCGERIVEGNPRRSGVIINRKATVGAELLRLADMLASSQRLRLSKQHGITQAAIDERCKALSSRIDALNAELATLEGSP